MSIKHLKDGEDFGPSHFPAEFGFSASNKGGGHKMREGFEADGHQGDAHHLSHKGAPKGKGYAEGGHHKEAVPENEDKELEHEGMAKGGHHLHPHGHHVVRAEEHPHGIIHHHNHGGFTMHHHDGRITHHHADGSHVAHRARGGEHHPGEGTYIAEHGHGGHHDGDEAEDKRMVEKGIHQHEDHEHEGEHTKLHLAFGGRGRAPGSPATLPRSMRPRVARKHGEIGSEMPVNRPPRPPRQAQTEPNDMPGDTLGMGVQPSDEPDAAGSGQGMPQLNRGGRARH